MKSVFLLICSAMLCGSVWAHGRSDEMVRRLNAPVPEWLVLGDPITATVADCQVAEGELQSRSGGAQNSRNRVWFPGHDQPIEFPHSIDWIGNNEDGFGVSLHPDRKRLIVNTGMTTRLYKVERGGRIEEISIQIPLVTYDDGAKGFILRWAWAGERLMIGQSSILDMEGHNVVEQRVYVFDPRRKILSRLSLGDLGLQLLGDDALTLDVVGVSSDLSQLVLRIGERVIVLNADLRLYENGSESSASSEFPGDDREVRSGEESSLIVVESETVKMLGSWGCWLLLIALVSGVLVVAMIKKKRS